MKTPEPDEERQIAWTAILEDTPVYATDGQELGVIHEVLGAEDIFHGIVVRSGPIGNEILVLRDSVSGITNRRIDTSLSVDEARKLPPYQPEESFHLGIVGLFRKHLGWVEGKDEPG